MTGALQTDSRFPQPATTWSLAAGLYLFTCGLVTAVVLSDLLVVLGEVIGLPAPYALIVFASPAFLLGAGSWWLLVERQRTYTYPAGAAVGAVTALGTGVLWTIRFVSVWGVEMAVVPIVTFLIVFVIGITGLAGILTGLPLMYARRRLVPETLDVD